MVRFNAQFGLLAIAGVVLLLGACGDGDGEAPVANGATGSDARPGDPGGDPGPGGDGGGATGIDTGRRTADPIAVPGTFEAEDFDIGGDYVGYHDNALGNQGGEYRRDEDVDIVVSSDTEGGAFDVTSFETGEWLAYTITVPETAAYDLALRVASAGTDSAFHVEVDGADATGSVSVPATGGADGYAWVNTVRLSLTTGPHYLKVHSERQPFELNSLRVTAVPTPYSGAPVLLPGTIEAEHFDRGGTYAGYHDTTGGNQGDAQFRTGEDVDIFVTDDATGGTYVVKNFEAAEWLAYTVDVSSAGNYAIEVRAATHSQFPDTSYRVEIDGANVTGSVVLPNTGGWSSYQWVGLRTIQLGAGTHSLAVVAEQPYFALNSIRVSAATQAPTEQADRLFNSGFEGLVVLGAPLLFGNGAWQDITGIDIATGQLWPPLLWGGASSRFQLIAGNTQQVTASTLGNYTYNALQTVAGRGGSNTRALYSHVQQSAGGATENWDSTQTNFQIHPGASGQGDLYLSYWLKFQPDLLQRMTANTWAGRVVSDWKTGTGTGDNGDYRIILSVFGDGATDRLYWNLKGDNVANCCTARQIFWEQANYAVPVPVGSWFRVEVFAHRSSGSDGRVWVAVDGREVFDRYGPNMGVNNLPWNRIMPFLNYSTGQILPAYQWVDDVELWNRFPSSASPH